MEKIYHIPEGSEIDGVAITGHIVVSKMTRPERLEFQAELAGLEAKNEAQRNLKFASEALKELVKRTKKVSIKYGDEEFKTKDCLLEYDEIGDLFAQAVTEMAEGSKLGKK